MNIPSVKTIRKYFPEAPAHLVRGLMDGSIEPDTIPEVQSWLHQCWGRPSRTELIMCALNTVLDGYGVECIRLTPFGAPIAEYINFGDTYDMTILLLHTGRFRLGSWGDFVEAYEQKHGLLT